MSQKSSAGQPKFGAPPTPAQSTATTSAAPVKFSHGVVPQAISRPTPASSKETITTLEDLQIRSAVSERTRARKKSALSDEHGAPAPVTPGSSFTGTFDDDMSDKDLLQLTQEAERKITGPKEMIHQSPAGQGILEPLVTSEADKSKLPFPKDILQTLPAEDHVWLAKALFDESGKMKTQLQMWYYPPQPALIYSQPPASPNVFFHHRIFLWMPYCMWAIPFVCSQPDCGGRIISAGLYRTVRRVIDQVDDYYMLTENLACKRCNKRYPGWSEDIKAQLDPAHLSQFPAVLTDQLALDKQVVAGLRDRSLGNSSTRLCRQLQERHSAHYLRQKLQYLGTLARFTGQVTTPPAAKDIPPYRPVPSARWLLSVYSADVFTRLGELKSKVTSTFGNILKLDSTKRVTKKLAGEAQHTAAWATNVGNEHGQILITVLTESEGKGLKRMASGLEKRYRSAGVPEPQLLYVDRDCCGKFHTWAKDLFPTWTGLLVRLDIWHFMRRLASCVSSESHPLYGEFMKRLSAAIFAWDEDEVTALQEAKAAHSKRWARPSLVELTSKELASHCRRGTRGAAETETLIDELLTEFKGIAGRDTLGVPLIDVPRLEKTWEQQRSHVECIQDPPGVTLYQQVGTKSMGGKLLPVYRCARGSTSLKSFHLHLNRFIPGESASSMNYQAYLLEGIVRWNDDRHAAAAGTQSKFVCYDHQLLSNVVRYATELGLDPGMKLTLPAQYTGELIGIEYLYSQTLQPMGETQEKGKEGQLPTAEDSVEAEVDDDELDILDRMIPPPGPPREVIASSPPHLVPELLEVRESGAVELPPSNGEAPRLDIVPGTSEPAEEHQEPDLDTDHQGGLDREMALAQHLVSFRESHSLSDAQVAEAKRLWSNLADRDRVRANVQPRHKAKLDSGRFGKSKTSVVPGTESVKRAFLGQDSTAAQWPDVSGVVEGVVTLLIDLYPAGERVPGGGGKRVDRWANVLRDYRRIRQLVADNTVLNRETTIQLFNVNRHTLTQWHNKKERRRDIVVLTAGTQLPAPPMTTRNLPPAATIPLQQPAEEVLVRTEPVPDRSGQAAKRRQTRAVPDVQPASQPLYAVHSGEGYYSRDAVMLAASLLQKLLQPALHPLVQPSQPASAPHPAATFLLTPAPAASSVVLESAAERSQKRVRVKEEDRVYKRVKTFNICKTCGQPKVKESGHKGYKGYSWCPKSTETFEVFLERAKNLIELKKSS